MLNDKGAAGESAAAKQGGAGANSGGQQTLSKFLGGNIKDDNELVQILTNKGPK